MLCLLADVGGNMGLPILKECVEGRCFGNIIVLLFDDEGDLSKGV